jgi:predicted SAM-dependent methyltransferase
LKINIGSGYKRFHDYINIDSDINCNPDVLIDLDNNQLILPFKDNTVDKIIAHHILEHIGTGIFKLLQEIYRVSKHGTLIDIRVPHHLHETHFSDFTHKRPITVEGLSLFSKKRNYNDIKNNGTSSTLGIMYNVDFEIVSYDFIYDSFYDNILVNMSFEQKQRFLREATNVAVEVHVIWSVIKSGN